MIFVKSVYANHPKLRIVKKSRHRIEIRACELEIDFDSGEIYVHGPFGATLLRISHLPTPIPNPLVTGGLDIVTGHGPLWGGKPSPYADIFEDARRRRQRKSAESDSTNEPDEPDEPQS